MAAPSGIVWGSIAGSTDSRGGRIGIYTKITNSDTATSVYVEVWFWSKYSVSDSGNNLYFDNTASSGSATTNQGSVSIKTTSDSGGWSTSNQVRLKTFSYSYNRTSSNVTRYLYAKLSGVDRVNATMYASTTFTVPALSYYTITYNANGGSGAPAKQTKQYNVALTLSTTKPSRTGYAFKGWATSAAGGVAYAPGANYTANASVTLYAVWQANTYSVTYNANGGSGAPAAQTKTHGVTLTLSSVKPTREGCNFLGWAKTSSATTATYSAGDAYTANEAVNLHAVWQVIYVKPKIENFSINRCDSAGNLTDSGTYARIKFTWTTSVALSSINVEFIYGSGSIVKTVSASGTSGTVNQVIGDGGLNSETTYTVRMTVTDTTDYSTLIDTLNGMKFTVDFKAGGNGVAFGKPAELDNVLDIAFKTRQLGGFYPVFLEAETDLNKVLTPNTYTGENITNFRYYNCPVTSGTFTLLVESCGEQGQIKQTFTVCSKYKPEVYSRFYYQNEWGVWQSCSCDEVVIYENSSGSNGTISLTFMGSAIAASHFKYLDIFFTDNNGKSGGYTRVWQPSGKTVALSIAEASSSIYYRQTLYDISGSTLTPQTANASYVRFNSNNTVTTSFGTNYIKIVRVIGIA